MSEFLYGKNPILEALRAGRRKASHFYFASHEDLQLKEAVNLCKKSGIPVSETSKSWIQEKVPKVLTQGWVLEVSEYPYLELDELIPRLPEKGPTMVLALDQIQDPQNLGAILRSAECTGVRGVLIPKDRAAWVTPAASKASAGAVEHLAICQVTNLTRSIEKIKEFFFWVVGTRATGQSLEGPRVEMIFDFKWPEKTLLVLGAEGEGMRRLTQDACDFLIHLPLAGKINSLNVSATAAVCLYEFHRYYRNSSK